MEIQNSANLFFSPSQRELIEASEKHEKKSSNKPNLGPSNQIQHLFFFFHLNDY